ncbi:MAG: discoidin domain-containing protein [Bacteroidales bacterium]|nr:discoidin domain-containing protein [Bacteroidales bacterium]
MFAADNNALEVRELQKSGVTHIPAVQECRDAFFNDTIFTGLGAWDRFAFDGDNSTSFNVRRFEYMNLKENNGAFRLDMGEPLTLDKLLLKGITEDFNPERIEISSDLSDWKPVKYTKDKQQVTISLPSGISFRYLRIMKSPVKVAEIEGYYNEAAVSRNKWRASNLFGITDSDSVKRCWSYKGEITGIGKDARLAVTVPANCRESSIYAILIADGEIIAANDRAPSFLYNNWEHFSIPDKNFTFYIPVPTRLEGKKTEVMLFSTDGNLADMTPEVWLTNRNLFEKAELILE